MAELAPAEQPVEWLRLDLLLSRHHPDNPKDHDLGGIIESIRTFGFVRNVMINEEDGLLLYGHGTTDALELMRKDGEQLPDRIEQDADGMWTVPTDRGLSLPAKLAKAYVIADNAHAMAGGWDEPQLTDNLIELAKDDNLAGTGFDGDDVDRFMRMYRPDLLDLPEEPFDRGLDAETLSEKWGVERGQLWLIGPHRVLCGDTTVREDLNWLMHMMDLGEGLEGNVTPGKATMVWTDPPYAVYGSSTGVSPDVADDKMVRPFFLEILKAARDLTTYRGHIYICCDWRSWSAWWEMAKRARVAVKNCIIWDKGTAGPSAMFRNQHEFLLFAVNDYQKTTVQSHAIRTKHRQVTTATNIARFDRVESARKRHNAQKPVSLITHCIELSSDQEDVILDPFLGTGSTMVAAETSGRVCYGMEIEPRLVAVTLERMKGLGLEPELLQATAAELAS